MTAFITLEAAHFKLSFIFPRISYSVYELKKLKESLPSNSLKVVLMYDIACILSRHLKVSICHFASKLSLCGYMYP